MSLAWLCWTWLVIDYWVYSFWINFLFRTLCQAAVVCRENPVDSFFKKMPTSFQHVSSHGLMQFIHPTPPRSLYFGLTQKHASRVYLVISGSFLILGTELLIGAGSETALSVHLFPPLFLPSGALKGSDLFRSGASSSSGQRVPKVTANKAGIKSRRQCSEGKHAEWKYYIRVSRTLLGNHLSWASTDTTVSLNTVYTQI